MEHIKKNHIAGEIRQRLLNILPAQFDALVMSLRDALSVPDLSRIEIEPQDRVPATALAKIKSEQTDAAAEIEDRPVRIAQQFVSGGINGIAAEFTADVGAEPALGKMGGDPGGDPLVFILIALPVFHLLRIIALPD
ncbi:MAG: hypothetical protein QOE34_2300 [Verrucomicrobiota bacterium]